jgi:glycosyltransferase involved in cell wall biosynthesis
MSSNRCCYALITAAKNEEGYIRNTLQSVVNQTLSPAIWVIVSDASTDRTDEYIQDFANRFDFIEFVRLESAGTRSFARKTDALETAYAKIRQMSFDVIGILDADISLPPNYYQELLLQFANNSRLGLAGGVIVERRQGEWRMRYSDAGDYVPGAIQVFRRKCYDDLGGYHLDLPLGGEDAVLNVMAGQRGWQVQAFRRLPARHHRPTGTAAGSLFTARFRGGMHDYFIGYHPLYEAGKCLRRLLEPPRLIGSMLRTAGYLWPWLTRKQPLVPADYVQYLRRQQMRRVLREEIEQEDREWRESA